MPTKSLHLKIPNRKPFDRDECWFETFVGLHLVPIINKHPIQRFWFTRYGARGGFNVLFRFEPADSLKSPLISGHENPQSVRKSPKPPTTRVHQSTDSLIRNLLLTTVLIAGMAGAQEFPKGVYGKLRTGEIVSPASLLPVSKEDYINPILSRLSWNKPDVLNLECRQLFPGWKEGMICTTNLIETGFGRLHSNVVNRCLERLLCNLAMEDSELTNTTPSLRELGTLAKQQADYALNRIETFFPVTFSANESEFRTRSDKVDPDRWTTFGRN